MLVSGLLLVIDENQVSMLVLLDLLAVFNTIDHKGLLICLWTLVWVDAAVLHWFHSFLLERFQWVIMGNYSSSQSSQKWDAAGCHSVTLPVQPACGAGRRVSNKALGALSSMCWWHPTECLSLIQLEWCVSVSQSTFPIWTRLGGCNLSFRMQTFSLLSMFLLPRD